MTVRESVEYLREDLRFIKSDLARLTSELADIAQDGTQEAKRVLFERITDLQSQACAFQERIRQALDAGSVRFNERIQANPVGTVVAVGVACAVVAWLVARAPREE